MHTDLQCGRAWLSLALNEASLESYFRSFLQHSQVIKKHYESPALLCDEQVVEIIFYSECIKNVCLHLDINYDF